MERQWKKLVEMAVERQGTQVYGETAAPAEEGGAPGFAGPKTPRAAELVQAVSNAVHLV